MQMVYVWMENVFVGQIIAEKVAVSYRHRVSDQRSAYSCQKTTTTALLEAT